MITLFSFTHKGNALADRIKAFWEADSCNGINHYSCFKETKLTDLVKTAFPKSRCIIFVGAVGIAVRAISPYVTTKDKDPAVISVDENGSFVVPLLSGHIGGANEYAAQIADFLGAQAVISTATDINSVFAVDVWAVNNGLHIQNIENIKYISSALLRGEKVGFRCDMPAQGNRPDFFSETASEVGISIGESSGMPFAKTLRLIPKAYCLGIGCRKNIDSALFESEILRFLEINKIDRELIFGLASIDLKAEEKAILDFCKKYRLNFTTYTAEELSIVNGDFTVSEFVKSVTGVDNVCERSAVKLSGDGELITKKTAANGVTIAACKREWRCNFETCYGRR